MSPITGAIILLSLERTRQANMGKNTMQISTGPSMAVKAVGGIIHNVVVVVVAVAVVVWCGVV